MAACDNDTTLLESAPPMAQGKRDIGQRLIGARLQMIGQLLCGVVERGLAAGRDQPKDGGICP